MTVDEQPLYLQIRDWQMSEAALQFFKSRLAVAIRVHYSWCNKEMWTNITIQDLILP
jgi:hypothetical protein